jgi:hypothetical protein
VIATALMLALTFYSPTEGKTVVMAKYSIGQEGSQGAAGTVFPSLSNLTSKDSV